MVIYFYKADGPYGCFSNFSPHPIQAAGRAWPTVEHYYQAQKLVGTPDEALMEVIRQMPTPEAAAQLGRDQARSIRADWELVKYSVMLEAVRLKFQTHAPARQVLLATGKADLVEQSPVDYYWGCGQDGSGCNHLGRILMTVRAELQEQALQHQ
ncbi:MAG: NADAR family protein [Gloeomargaritaceae cyanobacterium C42_A2020_066]|nr:NADAR family protein [Gloeomargaritaceae cyanobacterium C42_A2020_066]